MSIVQRVTKWELTQELGDLIRELDQEDGCSLAQAYRQSWTHGYDPTGKLDRIERALFLLGAETLNTHCADCAGLTEDES